ncbi:MAG: hypothetical protein K2X93_03945, partial [Candidatus Obscuribacterales bacterium]|nr:hypothetical protein [Candidatus Obscuribacterales bacterium]
MTGRQVAVLCQRPQPVNAPLFDDGGEDYRYERESVEAEKGGNGGNGSNGGNGNGGNGGYGAGHSTSGNYGGYGVLQEPPVAQDASSLTSGFSWTTRSPSDVSEQTLKDYWSSDDNVTTEQGEPAYVPKQSPGFFAPEGEKYVRAPRETIEEPPPPPPPPQLVVEPPANPAVEALGTLSFEDSSDDLPALANQEQPAVTDSAETQPQDEKPVSMTSLHLAGFGAHPGAAISIAIGAGVGVMANQFLTKRSTDTPKTESPIADKNVTDTEPDIEKTVKTKSEAFVPPIADQSEAVAKVEEDAAPVAASEKEDAPTTVIKPPIGEATDADGGETAAFFQAHKDQLEDFF